MTEHGRVPVCREGNDPHELHCFHGHALLFGSTPIEHQAATYYSRQETFADIAGALAYAAHHDSYLLVSENRHAFTILTEPLHAPRQLARTLVAAAYDEIQLADWRNAPRRNVALQMAADLRACLGVTACNN